MKRVIVLLLVMLPMMSWGQKIYKNEVDKFTKVHVIETKREKIADFNKWKKLFPDPSSVSAYVRNVDGVWRLPATIRLTEIEKYEEDDGLTLLLDNDSVIILTTLYTGIGADHVGDNTYGFSTCFELSEEDVETLRNHMVAGIRVNYLGGYKDFECDKSKGDKLMKMIKLIDETIAK